MVPRIAGRRGVKTVNKYLVTFTQQASAGFHNKVGGVPDWLGEPAWPVCKYTEKNMYFLAQVRLDDYLFPDRKTEAAYLFIGTKHNPYEMGDNNAIVFQSFDKNYVSVPTRSIWNASDIDWAGNGTRHEFHMETKASADEPNDFSSDEWGNAYWDAMSEVQIGGLPFYDSSEFTPDRRQYDRLLFFANCDDEFPLLVPPRSPTLYVFTNESCTEGTITGFSRA